MGEIGPRRIAVFIEYAYRNTYIYFQQNILMLIVPEVFNRIGVSSFHYDALILQPLAQIV